MKAHQRVANIGDRQCRMANSLDGQPLPPNPSSTAMPVHENVRGPDYYH